ncbi:ATP-binding cassette domain-containing protein [Methylovorus sp. MP688]|uniref:ATP-binding cassette domain-containing protein n=1 Tax=Methylovorus sp. (strain MP688) TaxID=887061 RepID=UPI0002E553FB|nr:ATP-binding cassette domain-containing protein [Methylovorus sp. MP688]
MAGAVTFHAFVIHSILTNIAINSIIIATAAFGVMLMLLRVRDIRSEWQIFESFVSSRSAEQSAGKSLVSGLILRLQQIRLSRHASVIEQGQVQETLDHMQEVLDSRQEAAQYVVGLMIALGLLGTFIGLLETLIAVGDLIGGFAKADTSQNIDQALVQLIGTLQYPLTAMGTAFSASMFGLLCSLMLGIMLLSVRAFQADFMQFSRAMTEGMIAEATPAASTEMEADHALLLSRMAELQRLHQALQGEVRALTRQGADNEMRISQLLAGMERFVSINEKSAQNAESMNAHLASLPALIQLTDRMGHSVEQLAGTVVHAQRQSDLQQQSLAQTLIKHLSLLVAQVETAYGEHARQSHQLFSEMLEQRISAVEVRNAEADIAQQAVMHQHAIFERIFNAISPQEPYLLGPCLQDNLARMESLRAEQSMLLTGLAAALKSGELRRDQVVSAGTGPRLSAGQCQIVALARSLSEDPQVFLLDEPTAGVDGETEAKLVDAVDQLTRGKTVILATHSLALLKKMDRIVMLERGKVVASGSPERLLQPAKGQA